jgi:GDPmannose 4,6-dehydratase
MKRNRVALITGITGQDGSYLAEFLLNKKYIVHGTKRRSSLINTQRIDHIYEEPQFNKKRLQIHYCDLSDFSSIYEIIKKTQPDEIYNLAAQSHVAVSFVNPEYTSDINALGTLRILEAIKHLNLEKKN